VVQEEASVGTRPVPWFYALWFRVMVMIVVLGAALCVLLVPAALVFLAVGSIECLGPSCAPAQTGTLVFGALAVAIGIAAIALLIAFAIRPTGRRLLIGLVGLAVLPFLIAGQVWGTSTLSKGRAVTDAAMQLAFAIDDVAQDAVVRATDASVWDSPGIRGPDTTVRLCSTNNAAYVASVQFHFGPSSGIDEVARGEILKALEQSTLNPMLIPTSVDLSSTWTSSGGDWSLTVESDCQPLPTGE